MFKVHRECRQSGSHDGSSPLALSIDLTSATRHGAHSLTSKPQPLPGTLRVEDLPPRSSLQLTNSTPTDEEELSNKSDPKSTASYVSVAAPVSLPQGISVPRAESEEDAPVFKPIPPVVEAPRGSGAQGEGVFGHLFSVGDRVEAKWGASWYAATVLSIEKGFVEIKWESDGSTMHLKHRMVRLPRITPDRASRKGRTPPVKAASESAKKSVITPTQLVFMMNQSSDGVGAESKGQRAMNLAEDQQKQQGRHGKGRVDLVRATDTPMKQLSSSRHSPCSHRKRHRHEADAAPQQQSDGPFRDYFIFLACEDTAQIQECKAQVVGGGARLIGSVEDLACILLHPNEISDQQLAVIVSSDDSADTQHIVSLCNAAGLAPLTIEWLRLSATLRAPAKASSFVLAPYSISHEGSLRPQPQNKRFLYGKTVMLTAHHAELASLLKVAGAAVVTSFEQSSTHPDFICTVPGKASSLLKDPRCSALVQLDLPWLYNELRKHAASCTSSADHLQIVRGAEELPKRSSIHLNSHALGLITKEQPQRIFSLERDPVADHADDSFRTQMEGSPAKATISLGDDFYFKVPVNSSNVGTEQEILIGRVAAIFSNDSIAMQLYRVCNTTAVQNRLTGSTRRINSLALTMETMAVSPSCLDFDTPLYVIEPEIADHVYWMDSTPSPSPWKRNSATREAIPRSPTARVTESGADPAPGDKRSLSVVNVRDAFGCARSIRTGHFLTCRLPSNIYKRRSVNRGESTCSAAAAPTVAMKELRGTVLDIRVAAGATIFLLRDQERGTIVVVTPDMIVDAAESAPA